MTPRAEKTQKMTKNFKKLEKFVKISIKLRVFSDRLFVSSHGRRGGGGGGGVYTGGLMVRGACNSGVGATAPWGGGWGQ